MPPDLLRLDIEIGARGIVSKQITAPMELIPDRQFGKRPKSSVPSPPYL